ncbi:MAG: thiol protease/hemagglutinin PrtT [Bacteroidales bacterium]|nr:thiol protease/hemagglutinin PrtT [Bacteroidales bacterium]
MKKFCFTLCLLAITCSLVAGPVDQQKAQKLGAKFLSTTALSQKNANIQLDLASVAADRDATDYYVFNVKGGEGFVVIAGDDRVRPILAYSTTGSYNPNDVADGFQYTLDGFRKEIQYVREHNLAATPDIVTEWKRVNETGSLSRGSQTRVVVEPLCQTHWNQNYPWNSQCPEDPEGDGGYVYAGCAATAMGQVMKFWDWPLVGNSSHTYNPDGYAQQVGNFGQTEYHFELMPLVLDSTSSEEEIFYVAQLLHHLGIALDMQYSPNGSGASAFSIYTAFQSYFRYNRDFPEINAGGIIPGYGYTNEEWAQMLKDGGLDEHLPIFYSGSDDGGAGGHAFVCDGYDENDYFHFNWGWSGRDNAWCPIGALHTTRYDFNQTNHFIGHIIPQGSEYSSRPDSVSKMGLIEEAFDAVRLTWTNPTTDLNGNALTSLESVTIRRNFEVIATLTDVQPGADMEYADNGLEPGLYEYSIYVTNAAGISRTTYRSVLVGEKCNVVFQLHDSGGDGWKGASISVTDESGQRIAIVTMTQGSVRVVDLPLLKSNLNFIWNSGWYHAYEENDTDGECSFTIFDYHGNALYTSTNLEEGVFLTFENNCEASPLTCYPVLNLQGEYQWHNNGEYGVSLSWENPANIANINHFNIYRSILAVKEAELIAEVPFTGTESYEYFDITNEQGDFEYAVTAVYVRGSEQCESEMESIGNLIVTNVNEQFYDVNIFPNPTNGLLHIEGQGVMHISICNFLGQTIQEATTDGSTTLDLSRYESGMYLIRIETGNGVFVQKVNVLK